MKFSEFAKYLDKLESIASRNEMTEVLAQLLKSLNKKEIKEAMYLMQGRVVPRFVPLEFNFAGKQMIKSILKLGVGEKKLDRSYKKTGDLGLVAEELLKSRSKGLSIKEVYDSLRAIAELAGEGSVERKINSVSELLKKLNKTEAKFVTRILVGKLRLGLSDKTVLDAVSWSIKGDKTLRNIAERAYSVRSDMGEIVEQILTDGIGSVGNLGVKAGLPVASKLVERESTFEKLFERLGEHIIQPKYDGMRAQIHYSKKGFLLKASSSKHKIQNQSTLFTEDSKETVRIFSRNMESLTEMFPDVAEAVSKLGVDSIVIDSEVIGFDENTGNFLPFQETSQRRRKYGVAEKVESIPIKVMAFDILYLNGKDLTLEKLEKRISKLETILKKDKTGRLVMSESPIVKSAKELESKFDEYVEQGLEGLISKKLDTQYEPGTRNFDWIKLKFTVKSHLADTIDAVVLGYYQGQGQRAKFGLGALLLGVYNKKKERFESTAKLGTGITDEEFIQIKKALTKIEIKSKPKNVEVSKVLEPDVWVEPKIVVEVEADEITESKTHTAGMKEGGKGLSLRFPRMKVFDRDKGPEQTTSIKELKRLFKLQRTK
ncbi:MAG TPA: ATP-dependent DNA ligase [bacterium]|nr:ATP-dependent DNA ligase [bacterium]